MGKKNKKKFNHLPDPETYTYSEFKSNNVRGLFDILQII